MAEGRTPANSVRRLGRYEILGKLATGGMAEILLGRLVGPLGFEKPVVIKRILPHLASSQAFSRMFLEEARLVAEIRHPNVVQVHELGVDADELFIVMEYLEGETVAGILRRLWSEQRGMDPAAAALIAAGAAAGLHAAHELCAPDGTSLGLVHRDVSPSNLLVTYDGHVKVLDFGIAKVERSQTHTDAGTVKGKTPYMSPEQALATPLDRRSDLFSLGIVLFEMCTLRRLFQRDNSLLVYRAICEEPIPSMTATTPDIPPALERICQRALARDVAARYPNARDMRRDLLALAQELHSAESEELLASMMQALFAERIAQKRELRWELEAGSELTRIPEAETDLGATLPSMLAELAASDQPSRKRDRRGAQVAAALVLVAGLAGSGVITRARGSASGKEDPTPAARASSLELGPLPLPRPEASADSRVVRSTPPESRTPDASQGVAMEPTRARAPRPRRQQRPVPAEPATSPPVPMSEAAPTTTAPPPADFRRFDFRRFD